MKGFGKPAYDSLKLILKVCHDSTVISEQSLHDESTSVLVHAFTLLRSNDQPPGLYLRYTPLVKSCNVWFTTHMKNKLKRTGARTQPYFIPLEIPKGVHVSPLEGIGPIMPL